MGMVDVSRESANAIQGLKRKMTVVRLSMDMHKKLTVALAWLSDLHQQVMYIFS